MARMTRTQITLEEAEYRFLKTQATTSGLSLSAVVRSLVRERMDRTVADAPRVWELAGLITQSDFSGKDHDAILYAEPTPEPPEPGFE